MAAQRSSLGLGANVSGGQMGGLDSLITVIHTGRLFESLGAHQVTQAGTRAPIRLNLLISQRILTTAVLSSRDAGCHM